MTLTTRATSLTHFAEVAAQAQLDPLELLREVGLPPEALHHGEMTLPIERVSAVLELAARRSGWLDFGLRMAMDRRLSNLGPLGLLMREETTLRRALEASMRYLHTYNQALTVKVEEVPPMVVVRQEMLVGRAGPVRQGVELAMAVICRAVGMFMGSDWRPNRVCFIHSAPPDRGLHHRIFGPGVEFGHDFNGLVIRAADLDMPNPGADPVMAQFARQILESAHRQQRRGVSDEVREVALLMLPTGSCRIETVARHLGVDRRTVHRQLQAEGVVFSDLVNELRRELAQRYVQFGQKPLEQVATLLGFSHPSSFSRWYRQEFGEQARDQRRRST